jgi:hypothetical protein
MRFGVTGEQSARDVDEVAVAGSGVDEECGAVVGVEYAGYWGEPGAQTLAAQDDGSGVNDAGTAALNSAAAYRMVYGIAVLCAGA